MYSSYQHQIHNKFNEFFVDFIRPRVLNMIRLTEIYRNKFSVHNESVEMRCSKWLFAFYIYIVENQPNRE